jgi:hypothetical protein
MEPTAILAALAPGATDAAGGDTAAGGSPTGPSTRVGADERGNGGPVPGTPSFHLPDPDLVRGLRAAAPRG